MKVDVSGQDGRLFRYVKCQRFRDWILKMLILISVSSVSLKTFSTVKLEAKCIINYIASYNFTNDSRTLKSLQMKNEIRLQYPTLIHNANSYKILVKNLFVRFHGSLDQGCNYYLWHILKKRCASLLNQSFIFSAIEKRLLESVNHPYFCQKWHVFIAEKDQERISAKLSIGIKCKTLHFG